MYRIKNEVQSLILYYLNLSKLDEVYLYGYFISFGRRRAIIKIIVYAHAFIFMGERGDSLG